MRKKRGPALYELINSKQSIGENPLKKDWGRPKREEVDLDHNVLTPGRSIRVSIGTIGVVVAVSIALIVISYTMGFRKGSAIAREDYEQLATFCRQKGLETYVVSGNNTRLYRVVALPGSTDLNAPSLRKVQSHIHAVGRDWAGTNTGRGSDLKDAYLSIKKK
jgi:hypothetical protein